MYCRRCGKELPPNTTINFCPRCGGAITTVPKTFKIGKNLRILGVIVGIWTVIFLVTIIDYNIRLSNVRESAVGLGILVVGRVAPSIELSNIIALLLVAMTILLIVPPTKSHILAIVILSSVSIILTLWIINQIPQLLYDLFVVLIIATIFNVAIIIFSVSAYKKMV